MHSTSIAPQRERTRFPKKLDRLDKSWEPWAAADEGILVSMYDAGATYAAIGERLGRTDEGVRRRVKVLRLPKRDLKGCYSTRRRGVWSDEEKSILASLREAGATNSEIGRRMGKTERAVETMAKRVGIERRANPAHGGPDTTFDEVLAVLHASHTDLQIAAVLRKSVSWVWKRWHRLGLRRDRETLVRRWTENLGHNLPPEIKELVNLRRQLVRKINEKAKH